MSSAEGSSRPKDRSCLRFKCSAVHELKAVDELPVHELSAVNDRSLSLRFKYSATDEQELVLTWPNHGSPLLPLPLFPPVQKLISLRVCIFA
jgi:hypothetical protein